MEAEVKTPPDFTHDGKSLDAKSDAFRGPRHHLLPVVHIRWITLVSQLLVLIQSIVPSNVCFQCFQCDTVVTLTSNFEATFDIYPNELVCELCKAMTWNRLELELVFWPLAFGVKSLESVHSINEQKQSRKV